MRCAVVTVVLVLVARLAMADTARDEALEARFRAEVAKISADAAVAWDQANAARDAMRLGDAEAGYRKVIALAPNLDHPHRRLCGVLLRGNKIEDAVKECEVALSLAPTSPYDKSSLAAALARNVPADLERAAKLAHEAVAAAPDDVSAAQTECAIMIGMNQLGELSRCSEHLLALAPDDMIANFIAAGVALQRRDLSRASTALERARAHGLPDAPYVELRSKIDQAKEQSESLYNQVITYAVPIILGWLLLLTVLVLVGSALSKATLRGADHALDADPTQRERRLRRIYRVVLMLTAVLFYASLPLMLLVVAFGAFITVAIFSEMGAVPIIVIMLAGGVVIATFLAVFRTLFPGPPAPIEGKEIDPATYPKLRALLDEVAETIGTRRVDVVYLVPGAEMAVTEDRGSILRSLFGRSRRILLMGVALFDGMKQLELRAILAHEYGHFRNDDVGTRVLSVQRSLLVLIQRMSRGGAAMRFNPAWWFVIAYTHLYMVVSHGASRLKEVLADRWALRAYGSDAFIAGYRHTVIREVEFKRDLVKTVKDVIANKWSLPNLYAYEVEHELSPAELDAEIQVAMNREPGQFDTHPSPRQRLDWAARLALPAWRTGPDDAESVWSLFSDPEQIERAMTAIIRERLRTKSGVVISDAEWEDE